jgi:hypothetical protein
MGQLLLHRLVAAIPDVDVAVSDPDDFLAFVLPFDQDDQVDVAVCREGAANAGPDQEHCHEIPTTLTTHISQCGREDLVQAGRLARSRRALGRIRNRQELRSKLFAAGSSATVGA